MFKVAATVTVLVAAAYVAGNTMFGVSHRLAFRRARKLYQTTASI